MQTQTVTPKEINDHLYRLLGQLDVYATMHQYPSTLEAVRDTEILLSRLAAHGIGQPAPKPALIGGAR